MGSFGVANDIKKQIRHSKRKVQMWMSKFRAVKPGKAVLVVAGSPKLEVYETDFGEVEINCEFKFLLSLINSCFN